VRQRKKTTISNVIPDINRTSVYFKLAVSASYIMPLVTRRRPKKKLFLDFQNTQFFYVAHVAVVCHLFCTICVSFVKLTQPNTNKILADLRASTCTFSLGRVLIIILLKFEVHTIDTTLCLYLSFFSRYLYSPVHCSSLSVSGSPAFKSFSSHSSKLALRF